MTTSSNLPTAVPYRGDDLPQKMAKTMAVPMLVMGVMAVAVGLVVGVIAGVNFGDWFASVAGSPNFNDLGRAEVALHLSAAFTFLGMGFILGAIVMSLVNIVRTLRDAGRDLQHSLGAEAVQLRKPWTGKLTSVVMMMGVMTLIAAFVIGIVAAVSIGGINPATIADPASGTSGDVADLGVARALGAWLPGLRFVGVATLLTSVALVLATIQNVLRFQAQRVDELATTAPLQVAA